MQGNQEGLGKIKSFGYGYFDSLEALLAFDRKWKNEQALEDGSGHERPIYFFYELAFPTIFEPTPPAAVSSMFVELFCCDFNWHVEIGHPSSFLRVSFEKMEEAVLYAHSCAQQINANPGRSWEEWVCYFEGL